ncbi:hypothetical protein [Parvibaculum sp.]|uniref:hypothetical protein n=1 Tax=Parvibaculum sp. TaxID=2024848 RepID=UPI00391926E6
MTVNRSRVSAAFKPCRLLLTIQDHNFPESFRNAARGASRGKIDRRFHIRISGVRLDPTEAVVVFGGKLAAAHEHLEAEYRVDPRHGHKGQYSNYNRSLEGAVAPERHSVASELAHPPVYWLTRQMGGPPMM